MSEGLKFLPCPACGGAAEFMVVEGKIFVSCPECGMCGPSLAESCRNFKKIDGQIDADGACIAAWNALPRRLRWAKERPTEPGWYWVKNKGCRLARIVHIHEADLYDVARFYTEIAVIAGPIPEPEEATA